MSRLWMASCRASPLLAHVRRTAHVEFWGVWAVLKRGFYGTYHSFSLRHLPRYLDEFSFRLNEGNCRYDTVDRLESLIRGVKGKRLTWKMLTQGI